MKKKIVFIVLLGILSIGCVDSQIKPYKNEVCVADISIFTGVEPPCKEGQVFSFLPQRWGNEQNPILVSTYFCDFNFPIVQNKAGVTCVYKRRFNIEDEVEKTKESNSSK